MAIALPNSREAVQEISAPVKVQASMRTSSTYLYSIHTPCLDISAGSETVISGIRCYLQVQGMIIILFTDRIPSRTKVLQQSIYSRLLLSLIRDGAYKTVNQQENRTPGRLTKVPFSQFGHEYPFTLTPDSLVADKPDFWEELAVFFSQESNKTAYVTSSFQTFAPNKLPRDFWNHHWHL